MDRWQPQGMTFSLHEFPHVSLSHLFFFSPFLRLLRLSSPALNFHLSAAAAAEEVIIVWEIYI